MILKFPSSIFHPLFCQRISEGFPNHLPNSHHHRIRWKGYRLRDAWRLIQSKRPVSRNPRGRMLWWRGDGLGWGGGGHLQRISFGVGDFNKSVVRFWWFMFCFGRSWIFFFATPTSLEGGKNVYFEWVHASINCIWRNKHVTLDLLSMIFMPKKFGEFLHLHQFLCWERSPNFAANGWVNSPTFRNLGPEINHGGLHPLNSTFPQLTPSWSRPLGVKQVARPNVGYCRQLVDFEKTSTGWGDLVVWWLGVGLENYTPPWKLPGRCWLARLQKINLVVFWFPCIQAEIQIHKKQKKIHHGQQKGKKSEATNTKRKQSNQTEGSSGLA